MDRRQSAAESATLVAEQFFPEEGIAHHWEQQRARCYSAATAYVALTGDLDEIQGATIAVSDVRSRVDEVVGQLASAAHGVDQYYNANRARLEEAVSLRESVPRLVAQVRAAAADVRGQAAESEFAGYPSVHGAMVAVDEAFAALNSLNPKREPAAARTAANHLEAAAKDLAHALEQAATMDPAARKALASVTTRVAAVRNRAGALSSAYSALLREFHAASSDDLANNERASERDIAAADEALDQARLAVAENNPELALELTTEARAHLAEAEQLVDAVTDRLNQLRAIRANPQEKADAVRFRLRDAQMMAVGQGLTAEWASVLDAQVDRIDRTTSMLSGRNPDYWAYATELEAVADFIAGVVERMRKQPRPRQG